MTNIEAEPMGLAVGPKGAAKLTAISLTPDDVGSLFADGPPAEGATVTITAKVGAPSEGGGLSLDIESADVGSPEGMEEEEGEVEEMEEMEEPEGMEGVLSDEEEEAVLGYKRPKKNFRPPFGGRAFED